MPRAYASAVIEAPVGTVWATVRNFNALPDWHPLVDDSRIEQRRAADQVGCIRNLTLGDGGRIREQLLGLSDYDFACTYAILESPMEVRNYVATLRLFPITDRNHAFAEWTAEFDCAPADEAPLLRQIGEGVFAAGLAALKRIFDGR
ncbi:MAG: SRPBCC family protein [Alphaproteobacteria bacterium]